MHGYRGVYRVLVERPEGRRDHWEDVRHKWRDNIKLDLKEIGIDGANWMQLAQHRVWWWAFLDTVMDIRVP